MPAGTVRIKGLKETNAAFRRIDRKLPNVIKDELKRAANPVVESAREKIGKYPGASLGSIKPRATGRSVFVRQNARKRTGRRPDFGAIQMRLLLVALFEQQDEVLREVERALDRLGTEEGF